MRKFGSVYNGLVKLLVLMVFPVTLWGQSYTAKYVSVGGNSNGHYVYLPAGYNDAANATKKYPVILFIHGIGELGNGTSELYKMNNTGLPQLINQGRFPSSFTVNGSQFQFIVVCPQFVYWPGAENINAFYDHILSNYRADASRLYLTGLSMGGGAIWDYAGTSTANSGRVAAILPICGATTPTTEKCKNMATTNLPVWATHNDQDGTVYVGNTHGFVDGINNFNPQIRAQKTIFYVYGHDSWTKTYDPGYKLTGTLNAYEWMLQYSRNGAYQPPPPTPTPMSVWIDKKTDVTCKSWNNGTATAALSGGVYPYSYTWNTNPVQTASKATNLPPGTYTVTVKDAAGTTATASTTIYEPQALVLTVTPGTITNNGGTTNVALSATGGTAPYTFTGPTTNVKAGTYTYEVKDSRGCTSTKTITITEPAPTSSNLVLWISSTNKVTCNGAADGTATVSTSGGAAPLTYSWNTNPVQTTATATKLPAGTWVVTVKDALGVTGTATANITQPDKLVISVLPGKITTNGGTTYVTVSASGGTAPYSFTGPTSNVKAGTYTYTVKDSKGCTETKTITISEPAPTTSNLAVWISNNTPPCFGMNNGSSTVTTFGGVAPITYSWNTNPVQTTATASNLAPGTYVVTVKDATGTTLTATAYISNPPKLELNVTAGTISTYGGSTNVTVSASGGSAPYSFTGATTDVKAGTYTYTVKDAYGCTDSKTITITEPAPPTNFVVAISSTDVTCWGWTTGNAKAIPTGGVAPYTYTWSTGQTSMSIGSLKAGSYSVTVKDAVGATATASVVIKEPQRLLLEVLAGTISEYGGTTYVTLSATGGNNGYSFAGPTSDVKAGTYTYGVTDARGCTDYKTIVITQPAPAVLTAEISGSTNVSCNGGDDGTAYVTANGGVPPYTYTWNTNPVQNNAAAASLKAGTYTVNVKDANNSVATATVTIIEPAELELLITPGTIAAYGGTTNVVLTATGGTGPYNFSGQKENLPAGTYTYDVVDSKGCTDFETITITQPAPPSLEASIKGENVGCNGGNNGTATVTVTGGVAPYTYSWNTDPVQTEATATGLKAGTYEVTVADAVNTKITSAVTITEPVKLQLTVVPGTIVTYGGTTSVSVSAIGGTEPYVLSGVTADLKAGTYNYEVKDAAGCTDTKTITIADGTPPELAAKVSGTNVSCNGGNNGSATASAAGGVAPYQYSWNTDPAQTGASVSGLKAGTYIVTVTDALNATTTATVNISEPAKLSLTAVAGTIASYGGTTDVALTATGGSVPYDFTGVTSNLKAGTYSFEVKDAAGCKEVTTLTITQPAPQMLTAAITDSKNISCNGAANGSATVTAAGGVAPYSYSWNTVPAQTGTTVSDLKAGTYMVTVTDALNATATATVKISEPSLLALTAAAGGIPANGGTTDVVLNASGGTAPYVYSGQTTGLAAGSYTYSVTDAAGCNATTTVLIGQPDKLNLTAVAGTIKCNGGTTDVVLTATGGKPPYQFEGNTTGLKAGVYNFTVTDAAGTKSNATIQIKDPATLELVVNPGAIKRVGGTTFVDINARGGTMPYTFTGEVSNLRAGTYNYLVSDANSCTATQSIEIKEPKVNLAAFDVGTVDTSVRINWKTSYEYAIDHFTVEKSTDGASFNPIGAVNSRWSAATLFDYIMNDARPSPAKNVYRIAAVTIYGEKLILQEKSIMFAEHAKITLKNLAERIEVNISSNLEENINFTLFDMNGKALKSIQARKYVYSLRTTIDMQSLPRGTYVLRILSPTIKSSKQVIRL